MADTVDIDPARGNIGGDQRANVSAAKGHEHALALNL
jgi:hypothetical protein